MTPINATITSGLLLYLVVPFCVCPVIPELEHSSWFGDLVFSVEPFSSSPHQTWSTEQESKLRPSVYQTDAQPAVLSVGGAPRQNRTGIPALQERRIASNACRAQSLEPAERIERSPDAYRAPALPLSYTGWSRRADSNRHLLYEGSVLPTKLLRHGASNRIRTGVRTMARSNPSR